MSSETLEEGSVFDCFQTKNKILEEMESVSLSDFSSKCEDDASICHPNVHNAGLSDLSMKESMVCDGIVGNNEFGELLPLPNADAIKVQTVKVQEPSKETDGVSLSDDPGSLTEVEISRNGINLFVEVFGPLDGACVSKGKNENSEGSLNAMGKSKTEDVLSLPHFEPLAFLARVKEFASGVYPPSKNELTVVKSRLESFYCSTGHLELPLQVLLEAKYKDCNTNNNGNNSNNVSGGCLRSVRTIKKRRPVDYDDLCSGNKTVSGSRERKKRSPVDYDDLCSGNKTVSGTRERKKSKFLSYPFTDIEKEMDKNSKKKGATKSLKDNHRISKEDDIRATSSKLLTNLHSMACGYFYGRKYSDSLRTFYGSFRSYTYLDPDTADVEIKRMQERIKKAKKSETPSSNLESVKKRAGKKFFKKGKSLVKGSSVVKREDQSPISMGTNVSRDSSCMNTNNILIPNPPGIIPVGGLSENEGLVCPNINGADNSASAKVPSSEDEGLVCPNINVADNSASAKVPSSEDEGLVCPNIIVADNSASAKVPSSEDEGLVCPNINVADNSASAKVPSSEDASQKLPQIFNVAVMNDQLSQPTQLQCPKSDEPKKRKIEEKIFQFSDSVFIPDLNGDMLEMMNMDMRSPSEKSTISEEHESKKRALDREEDPGGSITLNFAPGSELPSKEKLFTEFSRYGLVKQSEIKVISECVIQIPYERTPDVKFAHRSLERRHSFGESLLSFDLHCKEEKKPEKKKQMQNPVVNVSVNAFKNWARPVERPDIAYMKKQVEGMKSTLAKLGDKISPETRVMLEKEIQAFLEKIGGGSSSSS